MVCILPYPLQVTKSPKRPQQRALGPLSGVGTRLTRRIAAEARLAGQAAQLPGSLSGAMAGTTVIGGAVTNHIRVTLEIGYRFELFLLFIVYIWRTSLIVRSFSGWVNANRVRLANAQKHGGYFRTG